MRENKKGRPNFNAMRQAGENHIVEKVGRELRSMMTWMRK
jgi:ketol-acid reductoisomerase